MAENFQLQIYKEMALSLHCHKSKGAIIPAKPILLIGICNAIDCGLISNNRISITEVEKQYRILQKQYLVKTTFNYPFYFLDSEPFYHLKWNEKKIETNTPSVAMLRSNIEYAYLDDALWDLLQDKETRYYFRKAIEDYYLK